jgi:2-polyprenyl-3-methyl-5-hydroxy-6-metoxy-1,4-benzoquinol methylase
MMVQDAEYFSNRREEVAELVDANAKTILDVGCAYGLLGASLKSIDHERVVVGIEKDPAAANQARRVLDKVIRTDIEDGNLTELKEKFDCIIFADILEHLRDPRAVLEKFREYLRVHGYIVCSIPNVRHYTVFIRLLLKGWEYEDYGIFDRTHIRFFSLKPMIRLIEGAGYKIEIIKPNIVCSRKAKILNTLAMNKLGDFLAMQYIFKARAV